MDGLFAFAGIIAWLGLGGWAFGVLASRPPDLTTDQVGAAAVLCIIFGPFVAGLALAGLLQRGSNKETE